MVTIAQWLESWIVSPVVVGSSPTGHPINKEKNLRGLCVPFSVWHCVVSLMMTQKGRNRKKTLLTKDTLGVKEHK